MGKFSPGYLILLDTHSMPLGLFASEYGIFGFFINKVGSNQSLVEFLASFEINEIKWDEIIWDSKWDLIENFAENLRKKIKFWKDFK